MAKTSTQSGPNKALIIAEKPSVAADIARALGGFTKHEDYFESDEFVVSSAVGHLLEIAAPDAYEVKRGKWSFANLPVIPPHFDLRPIAKTEATAALHVERVFCILTVRCGYDKAVFVVGNRHDLVHLFHLGHGQAGLLQHGQVLDLVHMLAALIGAHGQHAFQRPHHGAAVTRGEQVGQVLHGNAHLGNVGQLTVGADVAGVVSVACRIAPASQQEPLNVDLEYAVATHTAVLKGYYSDVKARMRAVVDGVTYDIAGVSFDDQALQTRLDLRKVDP